MEYDVDSAVSRYRNTPDQILATQTASRAFVNPGELESVLTAEFLGHLDLDRPSIHRVLLTVYPYIDRNEDFKQEVHARFRFIGWMTIKGYRQLAPAYRAALHDLDAQRWMQFPRKFPSYETMREFLNERLTGCIHERFLAALLEEQHRILPALGRVQVEDATPLEARRRETEAPFNPHYKVRMHKLELRWDITHEALLTQQFYNGLASESQWLIPLTTRLEHAGIRGELLTVDGGYTSFQHIAHQWRCGQPLSYKPQEGWKTDRDAAHEDVLKRYQNAWQHHEFIIDAPLDAKLRFLIDHGTEHDIEAAGRYLRDDYLTTRTPQENDFVKSQRSQNEGLNAELKRLPTTPATRGTRELLRRSQACTMAIHLVQLTRLQHGITTGLCRTAYFL